MNHKHSEAFERDQFRANLLDYTRKAYRLLPQLDKPRILDVGCGSGVSTLELARLSGGDIVALDIDKGALDKLCYKAEKEGLSSRIAVAHMSMLAMNFPPKSFDIIWTEGAISYIGFERGLREWQGLLIPDGYLVVHDSLLDIKRKIELTVECGYMILGKFELSSTSWWEKYYLPMKRQIESLQGIKSLDKKEINEIKTAEREIKEFNCKSERFGSVFFILNRI